MKKFLIILVLISSSAFSGNIDVEYDCDYSQGLYLYLNGDFGQKKMTAKIAAKWNGYEMKDVTKRIVRFFRDKMVLNWNEESYKNLIVESPETSTVYNGMIGRLTWTNHVDGLDDIKAICSVNFL